MLTTIGQFVANFRYTQINKDKKKQKKKNTS